MIPSEFQPLANHLWQSTLFAGAAGLLTLALRKNRAQTRYWLWLAASVKFLIPFSLLVVIGGHFGRQSTAAPAAGWPYAVELVSQPFGAPPPVAAAPLSTAGTPANWIPAALCAIWAIGFAMVLLSWWWRWRGLRAALRTAKPLHLPIGIQAMTSPAFAEPGVFGIWRAILLLPAGITDRLTPAQWEAIVAHELCHVRRRDNLATAIHMGVEALFWFYPLVWWLGARLMEERERACDEEVLLIGHEPEAYAEGILKICELYLESPLPCVAGVTGANLKRRIEKIMLKSTGLRLSLVKKAALAAAGAAAPIGPVSIGILNGPIIQAQSPQGPREAAPAIKFESASVMPCAGGVPAGSPTVSPGRLKTGCATLAAPYPTAGLIQRVYGRLGLGRALFPGSALPVLGGPAWINSAFYVIDAKAPATVSTEEMEGPMLQALLEDRFRLQVRRETREVPVYELTVAQAGKLERATEGSCVPSNLSRPRPPLPSGERYCQDLVGRRPPNTYLNLEDATIDAFCKLLGLVTDRPILDKTGIAGKYNFHLEFATDKTTSGGLLPVTPANEPSAASIFMMVQQQLGLKLDSARGPREFLVVDHVERPSLN